ncbi:MAG: 3-deoxy-8-phosphooctulonate synthase [Candidatus Coatesbacteria bacterium]|nr:3-deoxy-8-phosphooctulonate synthase [Candidatus Coatesbacteria bacterium]
MRDVHVGNVIIGLNKPLVLIAGPCVIEDEGVVIETAKEIDLITKDLNIPFIFKSSYLKDNRSKSYGYQGPGLEKGLKILGKVKKEVNVPVLSDVHCRDEIDLASRYLDCIQIPAYLSQQTRLIIKAAGTGKPINIKKGQFSAPEDMANAIEKAESVDCKKILLTERGSCFGYRTLINDFRALKIMADLGYPVIYDVTHSLRIYGYSSHDPKGGQPEFIPLLARAGVASGVQGIFIETHPEPYNALCDASSMLHLNKLRWLLEQLTAIHKIVIKTNEEL